MLHQSPRHVVRDGTAWGEESFEFKVYSLQFTTYIRGILLIYCEFLGVLEYAYWYSPINGLC